MVGLREKTCYVRGKWILFSREKIVEKRLETFNLKERKNGSKFKKLLEYLDYQKIVEGNGVLRGRTLMNLLLKAH